jgi:hypothetical protein
MRGWRAADSGTQTIRLICDEPQRLTRISLVFEETGAERTPEFRLRGSPDGGRSFVRQQWNFSPPHTMGEIEDFRADLSGITVLALVIVPGISRGAAARLLPQESSPVFARCAPAIRERGYNGPDSLDGHSE